MPEVVFLRVIEGATELEHIHVPVSGGGVHVRADMYARCSRCLSLWSLCVHIVTRIPANPAQCVH